MTNEEKLEVVKTINMIFVTWITEIANGIDLYCDDDIHEQCFICKMMRKKFECFNIDIKIPDMLYLIIDIASCSNPGISQVMLKELLMNINGVEPGYEVTPQDVIRVFNNREEGQLSNLLLSFIKSDNNQCIFPILDYDDLSDNSVVKHYEKLWDEQKSKTTSGNLCDTKKWWLEIFDESLKNE